MKTLYLCDPRRNTTCKSVSRVEGDAIICMNPMCRNTTNRKYARRFLGIPMVNVSIMAKILFLDCKLVKLIASWMAKLDKLIYRTIIKKRRMAEKDVQSENQ